MKHSKRFLNTYRKMRSLWDKLIEMQKKGYIIFDENNKIAGKFEIGEKEHMLAEVWEKEGLGRTIYYGDEWADEDMEKWSYMKKKYFSKWRAVHPKNMEKII